MMKNSGTDPWTSQLGIRLAEGSGLWKGSPVKATRTIRPQQTMTFNMVLKAPATNGNYDLSFALEKDGVTFGSPCRTSVLVKGGATAPVVSSSSVSSSVRSSSSSSFSSSISSSARSVSSSTSSARPSNAADVSVEVTELGRAEKGLPLTHTIKVRNDGPAEALNVRVAVGAFETSDFNLLLSDPRCAVQQRVSMPRLQCALGTLKSGQEVNVVIAFNTTTYVCGSMFTHYFSAETDTGDAKMNNNYDTIGTTLQCIVDKASINPRVDYGPLTPGIPQTFSVTVHNDGKGAAENTVFKLTMPTGVTFVSSAGSSPYCSEQPGYVFCSLGTVAAGGEINFPLVFDHQTSSCTARQIIMEATVSTTTPNETPFYPLPLYVGVDC
jgi:uncharacterized repeat protein (TIGR01451 family)